MTTALIIAAGGLGLSLALLFARGAALADKARVDETFDFDAPIPFVPTGLEASMQRHPAGNARAGFDAAEVDRLRAIAAADAAQVNQ